MATYSDFVLDDYKRPILGAKVKAYASDGTTLLDATVTDALGAFTVTADDQQAILLVEYGGWSERSSIIIGVPPEIVGPPGPQGADNRTLAWSESFSGAQGQTTFTTSRDFYPAAVNVVLNGLDLLPSDFTTSGTRTVTLTNALTAAGNVVIKAFALIDGDDTGGGGGGNTGSAAGNYSADANGAKGDGTTDDTNALQAAIDAAPEGAIINFTPGKDYRINGNGNPVLGDYGGLHPKRNQIFKLNGATLRQFDSPGAKGSAVIIGWKTDGWQVHGPGRVIGDRNIHSGAFGEFAHGIAVFGCNGFYIGNGVEIMSCCGDGIAMQSSQTNGVLDNNFCSYFTIENVTVHDVRRNGISPIAVKYSTIRNNTIYDVNGTSPFGGIDYEPDSAAHYNEHNICSGNKIFRVGIGVYSAVGNRSLTISGNDLSADNSAVIVQDNSYDVAVTGNRMAVTAPGGEGAAFRTLGNNVARVTVSNNDIYDGAAFAVETLSGHGVAVTGNRIYANRAGMLGFARMLGGSAFTDNQCVMGSAAGSAGNQFLQLSVTGYGRNTYSYAGSIAVGNAILAGMDLGGDTYLSPLLHRPDGSTGAVGRVLAQGRYNSGGGVGGGASTSFDLNGDPTNNTLIVSAWGAGGNGADPTNVGFYITTTISPFGSKWTVTVKNRDPNAQGTFANYAIV